MPQEIEVKLKVDSHDAVRRRLEERAAELRGGVLEINRIFDDGPRTLLASDRGLRIRECRDPQGLLTRASLTYKGPRQAGPIKRREEIECAVDDPAAAGELLEALGYVEVVRFEKRRETWHLHGCVVELDEVPHLGCFVEIEGPEDELIRRVQDLLGLAGAPPVRNSYIGLLVEYCREHGLPANAIHF